MKQNSFNAISSFLHKIRDHTQVTKADIKDFLDSLYSYTYFIGPLFVNTSFEDFSIKYQKYVDDLMKSRYGEHQSNISISEKIINLTLDMQNRNEYHYIEALLNTILINLIDNPQIHRKFDTEMFCFYEITDKIQTIGQLQQLSDNVATYSLCFDENMTFHILKKYLSDVDANSKKHEIEVLSKFRSKFLVQISKEITGSDSIDTIYFPFFGFYSLSSFLLTTETSDNNKILELSKIDKIVILLEISIALNDLHNDGQYHGNLYHKSVLVSSTKDAYVYGAFFDQKKDLANTKTTPKFYYILPEVLKKMKTIDDKNSTSEKVNEIFDNNNDDDNLRMRQMGDIYSFGILMITILTAITPDTMMKDLTRAERIEILTDDFYNFLMSKIDKTIFEDPSYSGIIEIIEKCMKEQIDSFEKVIELLHSLNIYIDNKEEIDFRIENATSSEDYKCTLYDIINCYLQGNVESLSNLNDFVKKYNNIICKEFTEISNDQDIIKEVFESFEIKEDRTPYFRDLIDSIIKKSAFEKVDNINFINDKTFSYSNYVNLNKKLTDDNNNNNATFIENQNLIIPVFSLDNFINDNKSLFESNKLFFASQISKEISLIHSQNLFIGDLSIDSIGVYYDNYRKIFVPSIILYYSLNKKMKYKVKIKYKRIDLIKQQKNDIKNFLKILKNNFNNSLNDFVQENQLLSINSISLKLYNLALTEKDDKSNLFIKDYSNFDVNYQSLIDFQLNDIKLNNSFIKLNSIHQTMNSIFDTLLSNPSSSIYEKIEEIIGCQLNQNQIQNINDLNELVDDTKMKSSELFNFILKNNEFTDFSIDTEIKTEKNETEKNKTEKIKTSIIHKKKDIGKDDNNIIKKSNKIAYVSLCKDKVNMTNEKIKKLKEKEVYRFIEFSALTMNSFVFLFKRYIFNLNPYLHFRINVKLNNQIYKESQDKPIRLEDLCEVLNKIIPNGEKPVAQDCYIYVKVHPLKKEE